MALFPKQREFVNVLKSQKKRFLLFGGAVAGGKSIVQIGAIHAMAMDYPDTRWVIVRKNLKTLKRTSIPSYKKILTLNSDESIVKINHSDYIANYINGSAVLFVEADDSKDKDFDKLKGLEVTGGLIEEANEIAEGAFSVLKTRIGRWKNNEHGIRPFVMLNCNPAKNWVKQEFYDPWVEGKLPETHYYLPALPTDNPYNSQDYLDMLESLPEVDKQRYKYGNWEYADDPNQLVSYVSVRDVFVDTTFEELVKTHHPRQIYLGCDVARYGNDKSVICYMVGMTVARFEEFPKLSTTEFARIIQDRVRMFNIQPQNIAVDVVGLGGGTVDALADLGIHVMAYNSGAAPTAEDPNPFMKYKNARAQDHYQLREGIMNSDIEIINHREFVKQVTSITYEVTDKVLKIQSKESYKQVHGVSPDYLDATVMANAARMRSGVSFVSISELMSTASQSRSRGVNY